ncbi:Outer membrane receptor proteins, mostly Fe transport [Arenibacter palladensis]|uniref:Outer membrane receptor proteins, mostly Fe transport n=1 Tax=Arenibacter palladensis TaxID=237373 RepID=A0A1M5EK82_9FLAO|nr:carboxypeptidase-like regulatory domain-containing protein [Arenibacter palladensis]SHF79544.1 Outer membrane receptor proteins, mostly Fe transport [Arenibacter palladensis]
MHLLKNPFNKLILFAILLIIPLAATSQITITGTVVVNNGKGEAIAQPGVNVYWQDSTAIQVTNKDGNFQIPFNKNSKKLVFSHPEYQTDTINVNRPNIGKILLQKEISLEEVVVRNNIKPLQKSLFEVQNVVTVDSREMLKAACCNLSESFETNPTVDVNISDAVSGAKQIQMLGLNSPYLLFTQENIPSIRGASQIYGLSFIPGSWIESIQITKGAGGVQNGYESISGQINSELVKPLSDKLLFLNVYSNNYERYEFNGRYNKKISENLGTGIYVHGNLRNGNIDNNDDGFLDTPLAEQINFMNRWQYMDSEKGWVSFLTLHYLKDKKNTGQLNFVPERDKLSTNYWGSEVLSNRLDISSKVGYVFPELPYQSIGIQTSYNIHDQNSYYGLNQYNIKQNSFYTNLIFNSIINNTQNKIKAGINYSNDYYDEQVNGQVLGRNDNTIGSFFEYSYDSLEKLSLVAGIRMDHHNKLGHFITPRFHIRYSLWDKASLRGSFGKGVKGANIFAENQQFFASSRSLEITENSGKIYGLKPEVAWNFGISFIQKLYLWNRVLDFSADFYSTQFQDQVVIDWEDPRKISFYNLDGKSYSNSLQMDLNYEIVQNLDFRATYKYYDIRVDYRSGSLTKPLQPKHRFFANLSYETHRKSNGSQWRFDYTLHWQGEQRLPNTASNPNNYQFASFSPSYGLMNTQVTRVFSKKFEVYIGGENIANYTQEMAILGSDDPFGPYFDSTILYAPVLGSTYYIGLRYKL